MEKFTKWADKSGVNPFDPPRPQLPKNLVLKLGRLVIGSALFLVKVVLLSGIAGAYVLVSSMLEPVGLAGLGAAWYYRGIFVEVSYGLIAYAILELAFPLARRPPRRVADWALLSLALQVLGVRHRPEPANLRRLGLREPGDRRATPRLGSGLRAGDLLVCNGTSFTEVLWLQARFSPAAWARCHLPPGPPAGRAEDLVTLSSVGFFRALYYSALPPTIGFASDAEKTCLGEISRRAAAAGGRGPVVVFPEAVRTNGAAVLPFRPEVLGEPALPPAARAHLVLFNYRNAGFSPAHPVGPFLKKLFWICAQRLTLYIRFLPFLLFSVIFLFFSINWTVDWTICQSDDRDNMVQSTVQKFSTPVTVNYITGLDTPKSSTAEKAAKEKETGKATNDTRAAAAAAAAAAGAAVRRASDWPARLRALGAAALGRPAVDVTIWDHRSFSEYYNLLQTDKKAAAKLADQRKKN